MAGTVTIAVCYPSLASADNVAGTVTIAVCYPSLASADNVAGTVTIAVCYPSLASADNVAGTVTIAVCYPSLASADNVAGTVTIAVCYPSLASADNVAGTVTIAVCYPSLASADRTVCSAKKLSREPACPALFSSCFRFSGPGLATSPGWKTCPYLRQLGLTSVNELKERKRDRGALRKRFRHQMKRQLSQMGSGCQCLQTVASHRWHSAVRNASRMTEDRDRRA